MMSESRKTFWVAANSGPRVIKKTKGVMCPDALINFEMWKRNNKVLADNHIFAADIQQGIASIGSKYEELCASITENGEGPVSDNKAYELLSTVWLFCRFGWRNKQ